MASFRCDFDKENSSFCIHAIDIRFSRNVLSHILFIHKISARAVPPIDKFHLQGKHHTNSMFI